MKQVVVNWIEGRGMLVVCEDVVEEDVVRKVLKSTVEGPVELNMLKNLIGSTVAASLGSFSCSYQQYYFFHLHSN